MVLSVHSCCCHCWLLYFQGYETSPCCVKFTLKTHQASTQPPRLVHQLVDRVVVELSEAHRMGGVLGRCLGTSMS